MLKQLQKVYGNATLNSVVDRLLYRLFGNRLDIDLPPIKRDEILKSVWFASILAQSAEDLHRQKAQDFASLLTLNFENDLAIKKAAYVLYSRAGNLTATRFLAEIGNSNNGSYQFNSSFGSYLDFELGIERSRMTLVQDQANFLLTDFQHDLWANLNKEDRIAISAPTSSGKSFIIQQYIRQRFKEEEIYRVVYLVSSRALLSQVSEEFREILPPDVQINTSFILNEESSIDSVHKHLLVLTPERCLKLLQSAGKAMFPVNMIFVDEIQNIEEVEGRGILLEHVLNEMNFLWQNAKKIIAGPLIRNGMNVFKDVFVQDCISAETIKSPVFHIKTIIMPNEGNALLAAIMSHDNPSKRSLLKIETPFELRREIGKSIGNGLAHLVLFFASHNQSIIYAPKANLVQAWAKELSDKVAFIQQDEQVEELIDFLSDEIHPKYFLIPCLKKGVAFHHAKLPDIVRKEIEDLFLRGALKHLYCTSTLLEGVNLPANNLFIISPKKRTEPLSAFEFGNLIGRAGRIKDSLYGTVYCIQKEHDQWAEKYYETHFEKNVTSSTKRALRDPSNILADIGKAALEIKDARVKNTIVFLRHKLARGEEELKHYLVRKGTPEGQISNLQEGVINSMRRISITYDVLNLNPSIDPLLQQQLMDEIMKDGVESWIFHFNQNFYSRISRVRKDEYSFQNTSLFWQLESILTKLDKIVGLQKEAYMKYGIKGITIAQMCSYAIQWLENKSYRELIAADITFHAGHTTQEKRINRDDDLAVNRRINEVIKIHSTITTFILVRYLKLLNDLLSTMVPNPEDEKYRFTFAMPTMLELGSTKRNAIQLMSMGVNRSVALKVVAEFEKQPDHTEKDVLEWLKTNTNLPLKQIYNRYIRKLKLFADV